MTEIAAFELAISWGTSLQAKMVKTLMDRTMRMFPRRDAEPAAQDNLSRAVKTVRPNDVVVDFFDTEDTARTWLDLQKTQRNAP